MSGPAEDPPEVSTPPESAEVEPSPGSSRAPHGGPCRNCGDPTPGNYCPSCGQRRVERVISLRRLLAEVAEDQLSLNAALPRTLKLLLTRPGWLTTDYLSGRIARYVPPFRLYIMTSFVFFLAFGLTREGQTLQFSEEVDPDAPIVQHPDSLVIADRPYLTPAMNEWYRARVRRMARMRPVELDRALQRDVVARAPFVVFLLLPFFAGVLKLLYIRSRRYYVEHFVFSLHVQTFAFIVFTLILLADPWPAIARALLLVLPVYVAIAMKRVYQQSLPKTLLKLTLLGGVYVTGFLISMLVLIVVAFATIPV